MSISNGAPGGEVPGLNTHITVTFGFVVCLAGAVLFVALDRPDWSKWLPAPLASIWLCMVVASAARREGRSRANR